MEIYEYTDTKIREKKKIRVRKANIYLSLALFHLILPHIRTGRYCYYPLRELGVQCRTSVKGWEKDLGGYGWWFFNLLTVIFRQIALLANLPCQCMALIKSLYCLKPPSSLFSNQRQASLHVMWLPREFAVLLHTGNFKKESISQTLIYHEMHFLLEHLPVFQWPWKC